MERAKVENFEAFGALVKEWARGTRPVPTTIDELKHQAAQVGAGLVVPDNYTRLEITQRTPETLHLMLPVPEMVSETEQQIEADGDYPLPPFYEDVFRAEMPELSRDEKLKLHAQRIGDYTTGQCG